MVVYEETWRYWKWMSFNLVWTSLGHWFWYVSIIQIQNPVATIWLPHQDHHFKLVARSSSGSCRFSALRLPQKTLGMLCDLRCLPTNFKSCGPKSTKNSDPVHWTLFRNRSFIFGVFLNLTLKRHKTNYCCLILGYIWDYNVFQELIGWPHKSTLYDIISLPEETNRNPVSFFF